MFVLCQNWTKWIYLFDALTLLMKIVRSFCVEEVFKCKERRMIWEDQEWTKAQAWGCPCHPQEISKKYKRQSLGMPKASPSSSTKLSGHLSRHYIIIPSHDMCYSWSVIFILLSVLFCFLAGNKWLNPSILVWRESRSIILFRTL